MSQYPRVVVISSNPMRDDISNGILMRSLFKGWPRDRLLQIYFPVATQQFPQFDICTRYAMVRPSGAVRRFRNEPTEAHVPERSQAESSPASRASLAGRLVHHVRTMPRAHGCLKLTQELWYGHSYLQRVLNRLLAEERPDVVYFLAGSYGLSRLVLQACRSRSIPVVMHVTDDYIESLYANCPFSKQLMKASRCVFTQLADYASERAAVSPGMAREYTRRYGQTWNWYTTLVAGAEDRSTRAAAGPLQLTYAGNLGLRRWEVLRQLGLELERIQSAAQRSLQLDIYASPEQFAVYGERLTLPCIRLRDWVPLDALPKIFSESDVLVHVESSQADVAALTRYSLSTKISQYMMASRGILAIGPAQLSSMQVIQTAEAGRVLDDLTRAPNQLALRDFLTDDAGRQACGERGYGWASRWCSTPRRSEFAAALCRAAQTGRPEGRVAA